MMVSVLLCLLLLGHSSMAEPLTSAVSRGRVERENYAQVVAGLIDNLEARLTRLEANIAEQGKTYNAVSDLVDNMETRLTGLETSLPGIRNEINERRCETGVVNFIPFQQANLIGPNGYPRRTHSLHVTFNRPFPTAPWVSLGMIHLDTDRGQNVRVDVAVGTRWPSGFDAQAYEWDSSRVYGVSASWIACSM